MLMKLCLFGGTFDPIHLGHTAIAAAAADRYALKQVLFCPAYLSPFKAGYATAPYLHRFAMVSLATAGEQRFLPSDLESPEITGGAGPNYTVDTLRRLRHTQRKSDRLFFLCGSDAFAEIARWKEAETVLKMCEFIVAARPGHSVADVAEALPDSMRPSTKVLRAAKAAETESLVIAGATLHIMAETAERSSSTRVRAAVGKKRPADSQLHPSVAEYIKKTKLYSSAGAKAEVKDK
ncbi:MAG: nicotinate-nucleotide adenylyltransferase [Acidobacteriaceae bacterium]